MTNEFSVPEADAAHPARLDVWLASVTGLSRARIKTLIVGGSVTRDGAAVLSPSCKIKPKELYVVEISPEVTSEVVAQNIPLDVVYEDEEILVLNKPPDIVVHPAAGHSDGTLVNAVLHHCPGIIGLGGEGRPGIVHRLDKDTSGVMVVAKTEAAVDSLVASFRDGLVKKTYQTIVHGTPSPREGRIESLIGRHPVSRQKMAVLKSNGKDAVTRYAVAEAFAREALVVVKIETGRTHQIRVHMRHIGCPVSGDPVYGRRRDDLLMPVVPTRQMLHAWRLALPHPATGEVMKFEVPPPGDFESVLQGLRRG